MQYYAKTGLIRLLVNAKNPKHAAIKIVNSKKYKLGVCIIISEKKINQKNIDSQMYFLTEDIIDQKFEMKLVG